MFYFSKFFSGQKVRRFRQNEIKSNMTNLSDGKKKKKKKRTEKKVL